MKIKKSPITKAITDVKFRSPKPCQKQFSMKGNPCVKFLLISNHSLRYSLLRNRLQRRDSGAKVMRLVTHDLWH